jgi:hypothetical protein
MSSKYHHPSRNRSPEGEDMMRLLFVVVAIFALSGAMAKTTKNDPVLMACLTDALMNYTNAKLKLSNPSGDMESPTLPPLTIQFFLAQRRLEEAYCVQYARCVMAGGNADELSGEFAGTQFSKCLDDEAQERAKEK